MKDLLLAIAITFGIVVFLITAFLFAALAFPLFLVALILGIVWFVILLIREDIKENRKADKKK